MPPRRGPAGRSGGLPIRRSADQALTIDDLSDAVLAAIVERLRLKDRIRDVAPVCRRWRLVVNDPALLRDLDINMCASPARFLACLRSLAEWLQVRAAPHVQQLSLSLAIPEALAVDDEAEAKALVPVMLAACGAAGQLTTLQLHQRLFPLHIGSWMAPLGRSLQTMELGIYPIALGNLQSLIALRDLSIHSAVNPQPGARLPTSLTKLTLGRVAMLDKLLVPALTNLAHLTFHDTDCASNAYAPLTQLPSLRSLVFLRCATLPACLFRLTSLESLCVTKRDFGFDGIPDLSARILKDALPRLTALTNLWLSRCHWHGLHSPPVEVAALTQLRHFAWLGDPEQGATLPDGPWLSSLQRLVGPTQLLANSVQQLSSARLLEQVEARGRDRNGYTGERNPSIILARWALHCPTLQRLVLPNLTGEVGEVAREVQRCRPGLRIEG